MLPLYFSSFFILVPAIYGRHHWIGSLYTIMLGLSVLNHAKAHEQYKGKAVVRFLDRGVAHVLGAGLVINALLTPRPWSMNIKLFWACFVYSVMAYHMVRHMIPAYDLRLKRALHVTFHFVACLGGCFVIKEIQELQMC